MPAASTVLLTLPIRLRLHVGFLASALLGFGFALWGLGAALARGGLDSLDPTTSAAAMVGLGSLLVDRLLERFGQFSDDERGSLRLGSLELAPDRTCRRLWFGRRCVGPEVDPATLITSTWLHVRQTDLRTATALRTALTSLGPRLGPFGRDRLLLDAHTTSIDEYNESYADALYAGVLLPERAVFLPNGEATWRAALGVGGPFAETSAATLLRALGCLTDDDLEATINRCVEAGGALTLSRDDLRDRHERHGRWVHVEAERLVITLAPSERLAFARWLARATLDDRPHPSVV